LSIGRQPRHEPDPIETEQPILRPDPQVAVSGLGDGTRRAAEDAVLDSPCLVRVLRDMPARIDCPKRGGDVEEQQKAPGNRPQGLQNSSTSVPRLAAPSRARTAPARPLLREGSSHECGECLRAEKQSGEFGAAGYTLPRSSCSRYIKIHSDHPAVFYRLAALGVG